MSASVVVAMLGTDHHPFDRAVGYLDELADRLQDETQVIVQHGYSSAPRHALGHAFMPHSDLVGLLEQARVVICHGGPGAMADARAAGRLPICIPRDPTLGEHVDDHQQRFVRQAAEAGMVVRVTSSAELVRAVEAALQVTMSVAGGASFTEPAVRRFGVEAELLLAGPPRRRDPMVRTVRALVPAALARTRGSRAPQSFTSNSAPVGEHHHPRRSGRHLQAKEVS